jgi:hypothetical protein
MRVRFVPTLVIAFIVVVVVVVGLVIDATYAWSYMYMYSRNHAVMIKRTGYVVKMMTTSHCQKSSSPTRTQRTQQQRSIIRDELLHEVDQRPLDNFNVLFSSNNNKNIDMNDDRDDDEYDGDDDDIEWLFASPPLPEPFFPPLTESELVNRKKEMMLIAKLNCGDDSAIALFKDHWFSEHGDDDTRTRLLRADFDIGKGPEHWPNALRVLKDIIRQDWTHLEARARLSKLYCLMGRFDTSKRLSLQVLESKP